MNRKLDGTPLSTDDLIAIAKANGISDKEIQGVIALHNENLIHSKLDQITAEIRFRMFSRGELKLDTRTSRTR